MKLKPIIDQQVIHRLDPLKRIGTVCEKFNWLKHKKLVVKMPDGTYCKDYDYEFINVNVDNLNKTKWG